MPLGPIEPLIFVVGRQLALNQNIDAPTATRHGLVGALLGTGLMGPIIARELARRDAEATARSTATTTTTASTSQDEVDRIVVGLRVTLDRGEQADEAREERARQLQQEAEENRAHRRETLGKICEELKKDWQSMDQATQTSTVKGQQQSSNHKKS